MFDAFLFSVTHKRERGYSLTMVLTHSRRPRSEGPSFQPRFQDRSKYLCTWVIRPTLAYPEMADDGRSTGIKLTLIHGQYGYDSYC